MRHKIAEYKVTHIGNDWLTYALLQIEGDEKDNIVEKIHEQPFTENMTLDAIKCLIEAKELKGYQISLKEDKRKYYITWVKHIDEELNMRIRINVSRRF